MVELYHGDCLDKMKSIGDSSVDLVVTDCPYKIVSGGCTSIRGGIFDQSKNDHINSGAIFKHNDVKFSEWLPDVYRVLKPDTHCYIMINSRNLKDLQIEAEKVGFKFQNLLIWDKGNVTPNRYYMQRAEFILMLKKGAARTINDAGICNIFPIPNIRNKSHPTEKPVSLMEIFIKNSSNEAEVVLDCFMGSGSTGVACVNTNRKFIGIEKDPVYYEIARKRIQQVI